MEHGSALTINARTQLLRYSRGEVLFVMIFCPLLNSVAGIVIDLYAPSMPANGREFHVSPCGNAAHNCDHNVWLRPRSVALWRTVRLERTTPKHYSWSLSFCLGSIFAMQAHSLEALLLARALQGFSVGSCQVVARQWSLIASQADVLKWR